MHRAIFGQYELQLRTNRFLENTLYDSWQSVRFIFFWPKWLSAHKRICPLKRGHLVAQNRILHFLHLFWISLGIWKPYWINNVFRDMHWTYRFSGYWFNWKQNALCCAKFQVCVYRNQLAPQMSHLEVGSCDFSISTIIGLAWIASDTKYTSKDMNDISNDQDLIFIIYNI